jgi:2-amino-4-hydroxy-6-hydroxymethyldihydropteridine diphosphokinase
MTKPMPQKKEAKPVQACIGLGSNLGDRDGNLKRALDLLDETDGVRVVRVSSFFDTEPVGYTEQGRFLNAAALIETTLTADRLLGLCQGIENKLGRTRGVRWGPRTIDLDILLYGGLTIDTDTLKVPHPLMHEREFVLAPLSEVAPEAVHPVLGKTVKELLAGLKK